MTTQIFRAADRGTADFGWLKANFSFSFGNYFNKDRVQFGALRVLNDDTIAAGAGFGTHPHENMEIVTIPLEGGLRHRDSMGNEGVIKFGEVQVMSAGTGVEHSEMNASRLEAAKTLQLWVIPQMRDVKPRYDQKSFDLGNSRNSFVTLVRPFDADDNGALFIYQQAYFSLGVFDQSNTDYEIKRKGNGAYIFVIDGEISVGDNALSKRDAAGVTGADKIPISVLSDAKILIIEVPMS